MKIKIFITTIFALLIFAAPVSAWEEADPSQCQAAGYTCASVNVSLNDVSNWSGGDVEVRCKGGQDKGLQHPCCIGESATLSPGRSATLNKCDCVVGGANCVEIVSKNGNADSCDIEVAGGSCGGTNGKSEITDAYITGRCQSSGGPGPGPGDNDSGNGDNDDNDSGDNNDSDEDENRGEQCACTYQEQCIENGKEGTRTCNGANKDNVCQFSEMCNANCGECRVEGDDDDNDETPTPTPPVNRCNQPCETDAYCQEPNTGNCSQCLPSESGKTCQPPPGETPNPTATPKPSVRPTPTPLAFNPAMCKCDGIEPSLIVPGLTSKITAKAYVAGADTRMAEMRDVVFTLTEGNSSVGRILQRSGKIVPTTTSAIANRINYAATWDVPIPKDLKVGSNYRIFATINCVRKKTALLDSSAEFYPVNTAVLGGADANITQDEGLFAGISNWLQSLFGIRPADQPSTSNPQPSKTPFVPPAGTGTQGNQSAPQPQSTGNEELKLRTVQPASILTKGCTSLTFQVR